MMKRLYIIQIAELQNNWKLQQKLLCISIKCVASDHWLVHYLLKLQMILSWICFLQKNMLMASNSNSKQIKAADHQKLFHKEKILVAMLNKAEELKWCNNSSESKNNRPRVKMEQKRKPKNLKRRLMIYPVSNHRRLSK